MTARRKAVSDRTLEQLALAARWFRRTARHAEERQDREAMGIKAAWLDALRGDLQARPPRYDDP